MARYFFHSEGVDSHHDSEGVDLVDDRFARVQATQLLGEMLKDRAQDFADGRMRTLTISVVDGEGRLQLVLTAAIVRSA